MILTHGARLAHMLLVEHVVCEHGDLVDDATHRLEETASLAHEPSLRQDSSAHDAHHDHCDAAAILHRAEAVQPIVVTAELAFLELALAAERDEIRSTEQLEVAPKGSPPRV